jgi:ornithine decarboxylase
MLNTLNGGAVTASHTPISTQIDDLDTYVRDTQPRYPVAVLRPDALKDKAREFVREFPGRVMYAVKCNPDERVIRALIAGGVETFDCASIGEVKMIRAIKPDAVIYFMHPVKARESIREAYFDYGVTIFVLDNAAEIEKIVEETDGAQDLTLFVRMAMPKSNTATDFSAKFGAPPVLAIDLLRKARPHCAKLGISFHVGTHCLDLSAYSTAVKVAADVMRAAAVDVQALDIGGGFPANLTPDNPPPAPAEYFAEVSRALDENGIGDIELLCEPGRGLVADGGALVVRVESRRDDLLYINDGTYGGIFEGGASCNLPYPSHMVRRESRAPASSEMKAFRLAGPTCDSVDMMKGPFMLPADINEGDWIVLEQLGAYGEVSRTPFNGFAQVIRVEQQRQAAQQQVKVA